MLEYEMGSRLTACVTVVSQVLLTEHWFKGDGFGYVKIM